MNKRKIVNVVAEVLKYAILIAGAIFTLLPFLWMILSSLKTSAEITAIPPSLFPKVPQFSNFAEAWKSAPFPRYIFNTLVVLSFLQQECLLLLYLLLMHLHV